MRITHPDSQWSKNQGDSTVALIFIEQGSRRVR